MSKKRGPLALGHLLKRAARRIRATILLEPKWSMAGQITFRNGQRSYFRYNTLDINPVGSAEIAKDKDYANFFIESLGYPVIPGSKTFFSDQWAKAIGEPRRTVTAAYRYARRLSFPVVVKPNRGSQGAGVSLVYNQREFYRAARAIFKQDRVMLVQRPVSGRDYRIVVFDNKIISAYERIPLNVVGDGHSTIRALLNLKYQHLVTLGRDLRIELRDPRIVTKLVHQGQSFRSVPTKGQVVYLLDNANLSTGGDSVEVTKKIHPAFKQLTVQLTRNMGLRLCGVDLIIDGDIGQRPGRYWILEVNASPGLDHYVKMGPAQEKAAEHLYLEILKHLEKKPR